MKTEGLGPEKPRQLTRRDVLRFSLYGAGALLGTAIGAQGLHQLLSPEWSYERSSEFSKTPNWQQNFADMQPGAIDSSVWRYESSPEVPSYNNESQAYADSLDNVRIEAGVGLVLEAHKRQYQYPDDPEKRQFEYTSGRIDTQNSFSFEYGKIEATMKLPEGEGVWPAFWLLSNNKVHTINKTFSDKELNEERFYLRDGEIDILENYGNDPDMVYGTVHTFDNETTRNKSKGIAVTDARNVFHTYGLEVTPDNIIWTLDNVPYYTYVKKSNNPNDWPFGNGNRLYVILNLAMGGPAGAINDAQQPWRLEVSNLAFYDFTGKKT